MIKKLRYLKYYAKVLLNNWTVYKDSYAQHNEDKLVELLLPNGVNSFIDIGANDGVLFSNTYKFAKNGARGLCVEPSSSSYNKLRLNHLFNPKVKCLHGAVSNFEGSIYLTDKGYESTLSTVSKSKSIGSKKVCCRTFSSILKDYPSFNKIDFLSIDVEGHEEEVIAGLGRSPFVTKIIVIESDKSEIEKLLTIEGLKDYYPIYTNSLNTILAHSKVVINRPKEVIGGFTAW
jgi:FkbM family methyltransferase|tara:strand:+ start:1403 stop:2098 length:696 start_codon:yes stop_codon:yes gene_type:complete